MKEMFVQGRSLPEAYHRALLMLSQETDIFPCDDWNTTQKEVSMTMTVTEPLAEPMISRLFIGGPRELEQYRQELLDGILDFEVAQGNWTYTYHDRMSNYRLNGLEPEGAELNGTVDQIRFVEEELRRNPSSRRAVILVRDPAVDMYNGDPACLQHIQYLIRNGALHCKVLFRSNDACKAAFMNAFALIMLQKRIADRLGVKVGTYTHRANSFHCYEKDFSLLDGYRKRILEAQNPEDLTYDYQDGWDGLMEDAEAEIRALVEELKKHGTE